MALEFAAQLEVTYLSADAIAETLSPADPAVARIEAGRRFLLSVDAHLSRPESLAVETTLSGRTFRHTILLARQLGFHVAIAYVFLRSPDDCIARIRERVRKGGHSVPDDDVRRRFARSVSNFWATYREMADTWMLVYNGGGRLEDVATGSTVGLVVRNLPLYRDFMRIVGECDDS